MSKTFFESMDRPVLEIHPVGRNGNGNGRPAAIVDWQSCLAALVKVENQLARIRLLIDKVAPNGPPEIGVVATKAIQLCSIHFKVPINVITSRLRTDRVALARHVAIHLTYLVTSATLNELGHAFGGLDHGTILNARRNVSNRCLDADTRAAVEHLEGRIRAIFKRS